MILHGAEFQSILLLTDTVVYIRHLLFSSVDEYWGCFSFVSVIHAAMEVDAQTCVKMFLSLM